MYQRQKPAASASKVPFLAESPSAAGGDRFAWLPKYPGASVSNIQSRVTHGELNYGYQYQTADDIPQVISFYEKLLRGLGFTIQTKQKGDIEIDLHGESPDRRRMLDIVAERPAPKTGEEAALTNVIVAAVQK